jgi:mannose-6-phosphate isomerase-like protein (cupin superfamily)
MLATAVQTKYDQFLDRRFIIESSRTRQRDGLLDIDRNDRERFFCSEQTPVTPRTITMNERTMNLAGTDRRAPAIKYQPRSKRSYFDVGIGSICLAGPETGGKYCLLEVSLASGVSVPRHPRTREDEGYYVLSGELEVVVGEEIFILKAGDTLMAPRDIPHQLRNSGTPRIIISSSSRLADSRTFLRRRQFRRRIMQWLQPNGNLRRRTLQLPFGGSTNSRPTMGSGLIDYYAYAHALLG